MLKACPRCGGIHAFNKTCYKGRPTAKRPEEDKFKYSYQWRKKSLEIRQRARFMCEVCADEGVYHGNKLEVHHIAKARYNKDLRFDNYNLVALCNKHHRKADEGAISKEYLRDLAKKRESLG